MTVMQNGRPAANGAAGVPISETSTTVPVSADPRDTVRNAALAWHDAGYCVLPTATDGSKRPGVGTWSRYQSEQYPRPALAAAHLTGIGLVCGSISGDLEMVELEGRAVTEGAWQRLTALVDGADLHDLWQRLTASPGAYLERTPSGGLHILYRVADAPVPGNLKLARRPATPAELAANPAEKTKVLAETRGQGGYVVVAPSCGPTHPTGQPWQFITGQPGTVPTITAAEREQLHRLFRVLDQMPEPARPDPTPTLPRPRLAGDGTSPGDDYAARTDWAEILEPAGWREHYRDGDVRYWTRPGKNTGTSASTNALGTDRLRVFTTSAHPLEEGDSYSKFGAFAVLHHGGDHAAAARALAAAGYGTPLPDPAAEQRQMLRDLLGPSAAQQATEPTRQVASAPRRPDLDVGNSATMADWLRDNIGTGPLAGMFVRGPHIVHTPREGENGYVPLRDNPDDHDGPAQVRIATHDYIAARVQYTYACFRLVKRGEDWEPAPALFPTAAARVAINAVDMLPNLRRLRGVIHSPVFRPDGSLISTPGYDRATGLLYLPEPGLTIAPVPANPTRTDVQAAVNTLDVLLRGFPFVSAHARANYIGALITPLLRALTPPPYKLIAIGAHQRGSGKTKLAQVVRIVHGGVFRAEVPEDDAELRKQVTSVLSHTTGPVVVLDNLSGVLRSSTMAGLLTSAEWGDRPLGATAWVGVPNDRLWVITGNNLNLGGDIPRRTISVDIDPGVPRPELRTGFEIGDPEVWAAEHRAELLHALLTIVQAWVAAGQHLAPERASDGYARWVRTVEGILSNAGIEGQFDHASTQVEVGSDDDEWGDFLHAVHRVFGDRVWTAKELLADVGGDGLLNARPIPLDALPGELADKAARSPNGPMGITRTLGKWLQNRDGRWAGELTVRGAGKDRTQTRLWRIQTTSGATTRARAGDAGDAGSNPATHAPEVYEVTTQSAQPVGQGHTAAPKHSMHPLHPLHGSATLEVAAPLLPLDDACPICGWPLDSNHHVTNCEATR